MKRAASLASVKIASPINSKGISMDTPSKFKIGDKVKNTKTDAIGYVGAIYTNTDENVYDYALSETPDGEQVGHALETDLEAA